MGVYLVHHPLHNFSPEVGVGAYMVMGAYKVLYSNINECISRAPVHVKHAQLC